jgi:hypothetical protein
VFDVTLTDNFQYQGQFFTKAEELCSQVNEGVRERENSDKLEWMQNHVHCEGLPEVMI